VTQEPRLVDVDAATFGSLPCCGIKSPAHPGRGGKRRWIEENAGFGLRARALLVGDTPVGYVEYLPGEFAWRAVDARGYMFVHCVWVHSKPHQGKGLGSLMIGGCLEDAAREGMYGVAAMVRSGPWLADRRLYLASGFEPIDAALPDYELLAHKLRADAPNPTFKRDLEEKLRRYGDGLTLIRAAQCPHIAKFADDIAEAAAKEYGIEPNVVEMRSYRDAQDAPTPYAVFAVVYKGRLLADHPISCTRFRNIMGKAR
jgi:GNAT superfamily N-acetyltransferase